MKSWKRIVSIVSAVALLGAFSVGLASNNDVQQTTSYRNISLQVNGSTVVPRDASGTAVEPFIINGTTYLPIRGVASALGIGVDWDDTTHTVKLTGNTSSSEIDDYELRGLDAYKCVHDLAYETKICTVDLYTFISDLKLTSSDVSNNLSLLQSDYDLVNSEVADLENELYNIKSKISADINANTSAASNYYGIGDYLEKLTYAISDIKTANSKAHDLIGNYSYTSLKNIQDNYSSVALSNCDESILGLGELYTSKYKNVLNKAS